MGWDRKRRGSAGGYYYRSVRTAAGVRKVYLGRGAAGHEAAAEVERRRAARREAKRLMAADRDPADEAGRLRAELDAWAGALAAAWLALTGHRKHRGQWRKSRG